MMTETLKGRAQLRSLADAAARYEVDYEIHFDTQLRTIRAGLPKVPKITATVTRMQSADGQVIPAGQYELAADGEYLRLQNLGISWHVIASP
jgi:hypothetical protein